MASFHLGAGDYVIIVMALVFLYLAIRKGFEPLLLIPIASGMLLISTYPDIIYSSEQTSNGTGGLLQYFFQLDEQSTSPSLIFLGVGAMTDSGPLIVNPISFLMGAITQLDTYSTHFLAILLGFSGRESAAISIIGGADDPASLFLCSKLGQAQIMGSIAVAAYSYMALIPIVQPPFMKLLTTEKERRIKVGRFHPVSELKKILFPIIVTIVVCPILPSTAPLVGVLMLDSLFHESGVMKQLADTTNDTLMYIVVILLGTSVGATASVGALLNVTTIKIVALDPTVFIFGIIGGVPLGGLLCKITGGKINPLIDSAGVFIVPMAARVSQKVGVEADPTNFLLMHTMGPNVAGVTDIAVAAGTFMAIFRV